MFPGVQWVQWPGRAAPHLACHGSSISWELGALVQNLAGGVGLRVNMRCRASVWQEVSTWWMLAVLIARGH